MTMVLPSPYDVVDTHHLLCPQQNHIVHYSNAVVYGGDIDSIRRRSTSPASLPNHCNYFKSSQSDRVIIIDQMSDELIPRDYDPNQPSSSSIDPTADDSWLRLRLGSDDRQSSSSKPDTRRGGGGGLAELNLLPATTNTYHSHQQLQQQVTRSNTFPPGFFHQPEFRAPPRPVALMHRVPVPEFNWALMRSSNIIGGNYYMANPAAASMSLMPMGPDFFARPNSGSATQLVNSSGGGGGGEGMSSSSGMRIIRPPRRPHVGVWFMLQASPNQVREPFLAQIPKSYLRIKNGEMNIRLLKKYLVRKLGLESESEVEIRCRGQELEPILTLQHVRDSIWCTRRNTPLTLQTDSPSSSTSAVPTDSHIMILHYARPLLSAATTTTGTTSFAPII